MWRFILGKIIVCSYLRFRRILILKFRLCDFLNVGQILVIPVELGQTPILFYFQLNYWVKEIKKKILWMGAVHATARKEKEKTIGSGGGGCRSPP